MLIVGADSLIGCELKLHLQRKKVPFVATTRRDSTEGIFFDLEQNFPLKLLNSNMSKAVICAGITDMQLCENHPCLSQRTNIDGMKRLLLDLSGAGISGVFLSSSQVYSGDEFYPSETSVTAPKNQYGSQKKAVEDYIIDLSLPFSILRLGKVLGRKNLGIFTKWIEVLEQGNPVFAASNIWIAPVTTRSVLNGINSLLDSSRRGVWNLSSSDQISYYKAALLLAKVRSFNPTAIFCTELDEETVPNIFRPENVALNCSKLEKEFGFRQIDAASTLESIFLSTMDANQKGP